MVSKTKTKQLELLLKKIVYLGEYEKTLKQQKKSINNVLYKKLKDSLDKSIKQVEKEISKYGKR